MLIPPAKDTDAEDVVWGLQTAETLWKRGERIDALVWLRRAAQAAGDANDDDRALELARRAAELTESMANAEDVADVEDVEDVEDVYPDAPSVLPAETVHAGMFDPWAELSSRPAPPVPAPPAPPPSRRVVQETDDEEEVVTSVRTQAVAPCDVEPASAAPVASVRPSPPRPRLTAKPPTPPVAPPVPAPAPRTLPAPSSPKAASEPPEMCLDLDDVEAFADLPDDARAAFAAAAQLHSLAEGEEIGAFALAYVVAGVFDVAATVVDAPAARLAVGAVLRARGTADEHVPIRLICAEESGVVATWSDASVDEAFRTIPWVEQDLRASADRVQTLVGITIGPLGERLDASIREQIIGRLTMRTLIPGEVIVSEGEAVPGLLLIGIGALELVKDDEVIGAVGSGEFLFATEVLEAGSAPATARAGRGGALVMFGDRQIAQELLVTCPPLLEVFAGM